MICFFGEIQKANAGSEQDLGRNNLIYSYPSKSCFTFLERSKKQIQVQNRIQEGMICFIPIYPNQVLLFWRDPKSKCRFRIGSRNQLLVSSLSIQIKFCFFWRDPKRKCRFRIGSRKELRDSSLSIQIKFCFFGEIQKANAA